MKLSITHRTVSFVSFLFSIMIFELFCNLSFIQAQSPNPGTSADYLALYNKGDYNEALKNIRERLASIYYTRIDDQGINNDYIYINKEEGINDIYNLFRERKVDKFFIEDNSELFNLHLYAARCFSRTEEEYASLNHYFESLRYKELEPGKDDSIFYEISQIYKSLGHYNAYLGSLETAYSLNPAKYEYSLELGKAFSSTEKKKKAIFHFKRYIDYKGDDIDENYFLLLASLNEDIGKYLETEKYYREYLGKKGEDGYVNFALGYLAYKRTGNQKLALDCLRKSLEYLPEKDLFRRSKAAEYQGDIYMSDREYEQAINFYNKTKIYQDEIRKEIEDNNNRILKINEQIREVKSTMKTKELYNRYAEYQNLRDEKGKIELANREMNYEFEKLNAGKIRWNLGASFERIDKLEQAVQYYREAIDYNYNSNMARDKIKKLKLKIIRGY